MRRFDTLMSKTHGCVNPCYHVFVNRLRQPALRLWLVYFQSEDLSAMAMVISELLGYQDDSQKNTSSYSLKKMLLLCLCQFKVVSFLLCDHIASVF